MLLSKRITTMPLSAMRKLAPFALKAESEGVKVYHLNIGDPDIKSPDLILEKLHKWDINPIRYCNSQGEKVYLEAQCKYYQKVGASWMKIENILATVGGSEGIMMTFMALCEPDEEIIAFDPLYSNYATTAHITGVKLIAVPTSIGNAFHLPDKKIIEKYISPKTKAILYCNPNNPTGTVYTKEETDMLVGIAKDHDLFLVADEVYREFNFSGKPYNSILNYMQQIPDQAILIDSLSKRFSLCGARLGNLVSLNSDFLNSVLKMAVSRLSAGLIDQVAASVVNEVPESFTKNMQNEFKSRRDLLYSELKTIPGITVSLPEGAFYIMAGLPVKDAESFCIWLLKEFRDNNETVMFAPGAGFYATPGKGLNEVRIAYVLNKKELKRSMELLKLALQKYKF